MSTAGPDFHDRRQAKLPRSDSAGDQGNFAKWVRLFNRLDAAVSRHRGAKVWTDDADDALHAAHDRILKEAAGG